MRPEFLIVLVASVQLGCFVGGPSYAEDDETGCDTTDTGTGNADADELGCVGCSCDEQAPCDPGLECAEVCLPPAMAFISAGPFPRGCEDDICADDETPLQIIGLSAYLIDTHEVTVADYLACVTSKHNPCSLPAHTWNGDDSLYNFGAPGREGDPINGVTWEQATFYCERLGKRLPTEAEWEKAARGSRGERFPWGSSAPTCDLANLAIGSPGCGAGSTIPTGQLAGGVSPVGAFDMAGNVAEWVADFYDADYYATSPKEDPPGPSSGTAHGVRGGGWLSPTTDARTSARGFSVDPSPQIGFRCAQSVP